MTLRHLVGHLGWRRLLNKRYMKSDSEKKHAMKCVTLCSQRCGCLDHLQAQRRPSPCGTKVAFQKRLRAPQSELLYVQYWIKIVSFNVWVRYFVWNFKGSLWNSTQNILPVHWKMCNWWIREILPALRFTSWYVFLKHPNIRMVRIPCNCPVY